MIMPSSIPLYQLQRNLILPCGCYWAFFTTGLQDRTKYTLCTDDSAEHDDDNDDDNDYDSEDEDDDDDDRDDDYDNEDEGGDNDGCDDEDDDDDDDYDVHAVLCMSSC